MGGHYGTTTHDAIDQSQVTWDPFPPSLPPQWDCARLPDMFLGLEQKIFFQNVIREKHLNRKSSLDQRPVAYDGNQLHYPPLK